MKVKNPALPTLKRRAFNSLGRRQVIYGGSGEVAFVVYSEADDAAITEYLRAPEEVGE